MKNLAAVLLLTAAASIAAADNSCLPELKSIVSEALCGDCSDRSKERIEKGALKVKGAIKKKCVEPKDAYFLLGQIYSGLYLVDAKTAEEYKLYSSEMNKAWEKAAELSPNDLVLWKRIASTSKGPLAIDAQKNIYRLEPTSENRCLLVRRLVMSKLTAEAHKEWESFYKADFKNSMKCADELLAGQAGNTISAVIHFWIDYITKD